MEIKIGNDKVMIDGREFIAKDSLPSVKVGREWVGSYLGITKNATYKTPWNFPDWGKALETERLPYEEEDIKKFLAIPANKRKEKYQEYLSTNK